LLTKFELKVQGLTEDATYRCATKTAAALPMGIVKEVAACSGYCTRMVKAKKTTLVDRLSKEDAKASIRSFQKKIEGKVNINEPQRHITGMKY
jgi:hypothetical protein